MSYIQIPLPCPKCDGKMVATRYDATIKILKERSWHVCKDCNFQQSVDDFKNSLLTV